MSQITQLLLGLLLAGAVFWMFDDLNEQLVQARTDLGQAEDERNGLRLAAQITGERLAIAAALDEKHTQELTNARNENKDLQRAVDAGNKRLLVKATCSAAVPAATDRSAGAGLADAGAAELSADARSDYFTLRDQLALSRQMILGLQDHLQKFCPTTPTPTGKPQ